MKKINYCFLMLFCAFIACSEKENGVENGSPAEEYKGVTYESEKLTYGVDTIAENLKNPWAIEFLPDGRMLVTERAGEVLIYEKDKQVAEKITIPDVYVQGQGGLLDITLHPDYDKNGWIYLSYAKKGEGGGGTVIARTKL